jgi:D-serine deaminase-like pyridoxal phosphate-dependent protein
MNSLADPDPISELVASSTRPPAIDRLPTPVLLLDRDKLEKNLRRLAARINGFGVGLRPHMKTAKSAEVARLALEGQPGGIVVQTIAEAEYFVAHGFLDILYSVSMIPSKLRRLAELQASGATVTIICDNLETAASIQATSDSLGASFQVLIEIDADGTRSGIHADDPNLVNLARQLHAGSGTRFAGVLCHAGSAYHARSRFELVQAAESERRAAVDAATLIRKAGLECPVVSVGSTPSAATGECFEGVTEVRAGVYMFQDLSLVELGTCDRSDIALTVLASVIAHNRRTSTIMIDAGALALSKDLGFTEREKPHYGELIDAVTEESLGLVVDGMSQEHGIIKAQARDFDRLPIGTLVRILPNHACLTAAAHAGFHVIRDRTVIDYWPTVPGW